MPMYSDGSKGEACAARGAGRRADARHVMSGRFASGHPRHQASLSRIAALHDTTQLNTGSHVTVPPPHDGVSAAAIAYDPEPSVRHARVRQWSQQRASVGHRGLKEADGTDVESCDTLVAHDDVARVAGEVPGVAASRVAAAHKRV